MQYVACNRKLREERETTFVLFSAPSLIAYVLKDKTHIFSDRFKQALSLFMPQD